MNIIDTILNETSNVRVISSEHNLGNIKVELPDFDKDAERQINSLNNGSWDAAEYGMSREAAIARVRAAQTPEARAQAIAEIKDRAIRRASLDTSNGRVNAAYAFKPAWHGLGTVVNSTMTSAEAIRLAGLDWQVAKTQLTYRFDDSFREAEGTFGIIRQDTGAYLGCVGSRYKPIQNVAGFEFLDSVIGQFGAKYESAGAIYGGKSVWMLVHLPTQAFSVANDNIEPYVVFTNCHDGTGAAWCFPTTVRVECANTFRTASKERSKGLSIRHAGDVQGKIELARNALGMAVEGFQSFKKEAATLVTKKVDPKVYANSVLDEILEMTDERRQRGAYALATEVADTAEQRAALEKAFAAQIERRGEILEDIMNRYESERCQPRGTAWAAFNAVTEHADHHVIGRQASDTQTRLSRRFESTLAGERDEMKQLAYVKALAL